VIPEFYTRNPDGIPAQWVARMRESMGRLTPRFSANRTVREYTEKYYIPAAILYRQRASENGAMGEKLLNWQRTLERSWSDLRFGELNVTSDSEKHVFEVQVYLGGLDPNFVRLEIYADGADDREAVHQEMTRGRQLVGANGFIYSGEVPSSRPVADYTPRVIPHFPGVAIPLEASRILWQR